jgi:hypothetical protein
MQPAQWVPFLRLAFSLRPRALPKTVGVSLSLVLCSLYAGCSSCATKGTPVTGNDGQTSVATQAETAISTQGSGNNSVITVTYNDVTGNGSNIVYTPTSRTECAGASLLGWSYSIDNGNTWTYGGKVMPPPGWAILWGDPSITASRVRPNYVFISNLAVPAQNYTGCIVTTIMNGNVPLEKAIGGACIARSTDYGKTFNAWQCVHSPSFDFYDGSSMAAGPNGDIYAAYAHPPSSQMDIWHSPDENGTFTMLPDAFPGIGAGTQPRLRVSLDGALYVATVAPRSNINQVVINRFANGQWGTPQTACEGVPIYPTIQLSDRNLWAGQQFSFDVGAPSIIGKDEVRIVCTGQDPQTGRFYLRTYYCPLDLSSGCQDAPGWSTSTENSPGYRGDQFNPLIVAVPGIPLVTAPLWKVTYLSRENNPQGNTVSVQQGNLGVLPTQNGPERVFLEFDLVPDQVVCPDNRGYWGDYDGITYTFSSPSPGLPPGPLFIRAETDSTADSGCTQRWDETSQQVHVSSSQFY